MSEADQTSFSVDPLVRAEHTINKLFYCCCGFMRKQDSDRVLSNGAYNFWWHAVLRYV